MITAHNGEKLDRQQIPAYSITEFRQAVLERTSNGARLVALFGLPNGKDALRLIAVLTNGGMGTLPVLSAEVRDGYPSLTPDCSQAHWFEREIAEQRRVTPQGHPWLKPIRSGGVADFFRVEGEEIHEVAVGPVHAGIIEPGHFRFQCHGERVFHLEISLGFQHRGVERALLGGPNKRTVHYMETLAGDTTIGHALAYCQAVESLAGCRVPARAQALRGVALELERLANHTGDLGAMAGDIGYLPTASFCGRIRGDFLNMTALLCGNRFGRGLVRPGGVAFDTDEARMEQLFEQLEEAIRDVTVAADLLWNTSSVRSRFENTGVVSSQTCRDLGLVGVAARACGIERDVRQEFPAGIYQFFQIPVSTYPSDDVFARAYVRWLEIQRSAAFIREQLQSLPSGPICATVGPPAANAMVTSLVEGWRGEICHVVLTDERRQFDCYKIIDPSFHNWMGLAMAMRNQQISDFPLCNKSFNLSYCGHDL